MESKDHGSSPVSESDLTKCSKSLKATKGREHSDSLEYDPRIASKLGACGKAHAVCASCSSLTFSH